MTDDTSILLIFKLFSAGLYYNVAFFIEPMGILKSGSAIRIVPLPPPNARVARNSYAVEQIPGSLNRQVPGCSPMLTGHSYALLKSPAPARRWNLSLLQVEPWRGKRLCFRAGTPSKARVDWSRLARRPSFKYRRRKFQALHQAFFMRQGALGSVYNRPVRTSQNHNSERQSRLRSKVSF